MKDRRQCIYCIAIKGGDTLDIILHYPATPETQRALAMKVAAIHAQTVLEYIRSLPCPLEQKIQLLEEIQRIYPQRQKG